MKNIKMGMLNANEKIILIKGKSSIKSGYIWAPYTPVTVAIDINDEVVWYTKKWKNLWLKVKYFFKKRKLLNRYKMKPINPKYYGSVKINKL